MKSKSKSKTFPKGTDFGEVADWLSSNIKTEDRYAHFFQSPCVTKVKYLITITKYEDNDREAH